MFLSVKYTVTFYSYFSRCFHVTLSVLHATRTVYQHTVNLLTSSQGV